MHACDLKLKWATGDYEKKKKKKLMGGREEGEAR